jgi:hypothetical protein
MIFENKAPDGIYSGSLKNNRTQIKFKKPSPEKKKCIGWKEKKLCGLNPSKSINFSIVVYKRFNLEHRFLTWIPFKP